MVYPTGAVSLPFGKGPLSPFLSVVDNQARKWLTDVETPMLLSNEDLGAVFQDTELLGKCLDPRLECDGEFRGLLNCKLGAKLMRFCQQERCHQASISHGYSQSNTSLQ